MAGTPYYGDEMRLKITIVRILLFCEICSVKLSELGGVFETKDFC